MGGHGRTILGVEGKAPSGTLRYPLGNGGNRAFKEGLDSPGSTGRNAKGGGSKVATKPYFVENMPGVLTAKGFPLGASFMDFWVNHKAFQKNTTAGTIHRSRTLDHDHLKGWKQTSKYPLDNLKNQRPWLGKRKDELIDRIKKRWKASNLAAGTIIFPDAKVSSPPALTKKSGDLPYNDPTSNDTTWADEVDFWGLWNEDSASDGAGAFSMAVSALDDYCYALGCFDWYFLPKGAAAFVPAAGNAPNRMTVTISEVGIYARDSFDFNGDQPLGIWNIEDQDIKKVSLAPWPLNPGQVPDDGLYKADMGWTYVSNETFRKYRDKAGNGCDFLVYSDVKFFAFNGGSFTFDMV